MMNTLIRLAPAFKRFALATTCSVFMFSTSSAALSPEQGRLLNSGIYYYNIESETSVGCSVREAGSDIFQPLNTNVTWGEGVWASGSTPYASGVTGPVTRELWAIHVLKNIARKANLPEDTMVTQSKVIALVAWALAEGGGVNGNNGRFNPLNTKSVYADIGGHVPTSSVDDNSADYETFDAGVEAITRALFNTYQKRIGGMLLSTEFAPDSLVQAKAGDFYSPNGSDVVNRLEDIYPGDKPFAMASVTGFTRDMPPSWPVGDRQKYINATNGTVKSVLEDYATHAGKVLDGTGPGTPPPLQFSSPGLGAISLATTGGSCGSASGGSGLVDPQGYSFPLAPQTKAVSGVRAGQTATTHWDETDAYDLFSSDSAAVYAIFDGTPVTVNTNFKGIPGCSTIQFKADDGFYYWYGHLKNVVVSEGTHILAGTQMAEIADRKNFGSDCWGGGPHLHIDRGCTKNGVPQRGGGDECRDPDFIPFLSKLWEGLPD